MKKMIRFNSLTMLMGLLSGTLAKAAVTSIAFNTTGAAGDQQGNPVNGNPNPSGEPSNSVGLTLPGQVGPWEGLIVGSGNTGDVAPTTPTIATSSGATLTLNPGAPNTTRTFYPAGGVPLRAPVIFVSTVLTSNTVLTWELSGLSGSAYNLILFGQENNNSIVNPGAFSITGHDAGNGIGAPVTLDAENDANFLNVVPSGGVISGHLELQSGESFGAWSGMQFDTVPEPGTSALSMIALLSLAYRRRR